MFIVRRLNQNPIISPRSDHPFESFATFNASPVTLPSKEIALIYRAQNQPEHFEHGVFSLSSIGIAYTKDGSTVTKRSLLVEPEEEWERYGCEDPRVTRIDGTYYIFYTALSTFPFSAPGIRVGVAISKDLKTIQSKHLVTPFNAKAMVLFPEKINGKYAALLTVNTDNPPSHIAFAYFDKIEDIWSEEYWNTWYANYTDHILEIPKKDSDHVEIGAVPVKTDKGWLLIYSHIQHYFTNEKVFGIEALLLDSKKPQKVIGKTKGPMLIPEESYEKYGLIKDVIFPSGARVHKDTLYIYYGATDTSVCVAHTDLSLLLDSMTHPKTKDIVRPLKKPILIPTRQPFESRAVFNPAALDLGGSVHILYRAMSQDNTSTIGYARSDDGIHVDERLKKPIYVPRTPIEEKRVPGGNSGCEDPRLTYIDNTVYMYYTAYNGVNPPAIAMTSISKKDFLSQTWNWSLPVLVTKDGVDDKDGCLHPEKIKGKYFLFHRVDNMICGDFGKTPAFTERNTFKNIPILAPRKGMWDSKKVGLSTPPIKTKKGWLLLYHGVSDDAVYRVGAVLLDLKDPRIVLSRTTDFILEPEREYEKHGEISNVVFPCGAVVRKDILFVYFGGADKVVEVGTLSISKLLSVLDTS